MSFMIQGEEEVLQDWKVRLGDDTIYLFDIVLWVLWSAAHFFFLKLLFKMIFSL